MKKLESSLDNLQARMNFVEYWADFVRTHSDQEWGNQHTKFINALMQSAKKYPFTPRKYLEMKGEPVGKSIQD